MLTLRKWSISLPPIVKRSKKTSEVLTFQKEGEPEGSNSTLTRWSLHEPAIEEVLTIPIYPCSNRKKKEQKERRKNKNNKKEQQEERTRRKNKNKKKEQELEEERTRR